MKVVLLDRDGVVNQYPGDGNYVTRVKDLRVFPGAVKAIRALTQAGYTVFVVSNQAGVGRGTFTQDKLNRITAKLLKKVEAGGGKVRKILYCTHSPDAGCECRKPGIGLIKQALKSVGKTISHARHTFLVGDTDKDIQAGHKAGCTTILVETGRDKRRDALKWIMKPDHIVKDLGSAVAQIIQNENTRHPRHSRGRS